MKINKLLVEIIPEYFAPGPPVPALKIRVECNGKVIQKYEIIRESDFIPFFEKMMQSATREIIQKVKEASHVS